MHLRHCQCVYHVLLKAVPLLRLRFASDECLASHTFAQSAAHRLRSLDTSHSTAYNITITSKIVDVISVRRKFKKTLTRVFYPKNKKTFVNVIKTLHSFYLVMMLSAIFLWVILWFFIFLYINVWNYRHFHTDCSTFLKIKTLEKLQKTLKTRFYRKKIKKNVYKRLLQLWARYPPLLWCAEHQPCVAWWSSG